jgi:hypothetical protein
VLIRWPASVIPAGYLLNSGATREEALVPARPVIVVGIETIYHRRRWSQGA